MAQKNKGYALALFSIASEANLADKIFEELKEINRLIITINYILYNFLFLQIGVLYSILRGM